MVRLSQSFFVPDHSTGEMVGSRGLGMEAVADWWPIAGVYSVRS